MGKIIDFVDYVLDEILAPIVIFLISFFFFMVFSGILVVGIFWTASIVTSLLDKII